MDSNRFIKLIESKAFPIAQKFSENRYMIAIKDGLLAYMPFTIIGSLFLVIAYLPIPGYESFITNLFNFSDASVWQSKLTLINKASMDVGGLLVVITITKRLSDYYNLNNSQTILTSVVSFLLLVNYNQTDAGWQIPVVKIGIQAMFSAILVSIFSTEIFRWADNKGWKIKMPDSVPPAVSQPFESILPSLVTVITFLALRILCDVLNVEVFTLLNETIGKPLTIFGNSLFGTIIVVIVNQALWFVGIHGGAVTGAAMNPIWHMLEDQNRIDSLAGILPSNIVSKSFMDHFAFLGTIGAVIAIILVARSRQYKEISKLAAGPMAFNIGEPILFGLPIMLNPIYFIPSVFVPVISTIISYLGFSLKLVPIPTGLAQMPWTTPPIISGFFITGSFRGSILQFIIIAVATIIWIPFIKVSDSVIYKEESNNE